ncbi:MAG: addiction module toxin, RelE/StbE family [Ignavibacteria bacterium]|nr:addiction module toxin, RelE/StbE family [Ignavibacteria bacterium]
MFNVVISERFKRSYKKFVKSYPHLQEKIDSIIIELSKEPFSQIISTHKLSGDLFELYACKCGYDCRIIFSIEKMDEPQDNIILLVDIGTHDDVY